MPAKDRLLYLDYVKGFAIILVVAGHTIGGLLPLGIIHRPSIFTLFSSLIYTFHMPLFFFVSGYLSAKLLSAPPVEFARKTFSGIAAPYLIWSWVFLLISNALQGSTNNHFAAWNFLGVFLPWDAVGVYWFLYALLCARIVYFFAGRRSTGAVFKLFVAFSAFYLFYELFLNRPEWDSPFLLTFGRIAKAGTFTGFGLIAALQPGIMDVILAPKCVFPFAASWVLAAGFVAYSDTFSALRFLTGFLGTALFLTLARQIELRGIRLPSLAAAGIASLPIYVTHVIFAAGMRFFLLKLGISNAFVHFSLGTAAGAIFPMILFYAANRMRIAPYVGFGASAAAAFGEPGRAAQR
ncbi:MAG TPA: acyltransferase [Methylocella sp.]|nr:acyltransferase [Methylocella sp.]